MEVFLASENPQCKEALAFQKPLPPSLLCEYEPRFLQSSFWARFKSAQGWVPLRLYQYFSEKFLFRYWGPTL